MKAARRARTGQSSGWLASHTAVWWHTFPRTRATWPARSGRTEWVAITLFYEQLIRISPALGTRTGHAAAVGEAIGPEAGLAVLDGIDLDTHSNYQPYWAVRAHLLQRLGKTSEAGDAFDRAIGLAEDPAVRQFLLERRG
ncbi:MAG: hypothetical protein WAO35_10400 [Terriglobia bacterium]